ncbi:hypothetical protein D9M70_476940 [compost metagenome]
MLTEGCALLPSFREVLRLAAQYMLQALSALREIYSIFNLLLMQPDRINSDFLMTDYQNGNILGTATCRERILGVTHVHQFRNAVPQGPYADRDCDRTPDAGAQRHRCRSRIRTLRLEFYRYGLDRQPGPGARLRRAFNRAGPERSQRRRVQLA